jgi:1,2-diacylglycerol 3-beta-glucosyltransferase
MRIEARLLRFGLAAVSAVTAAQTAYLLGLCGAAFAGARRSRPAWDGDLSIVVLVPAHDEEGQIRTAVDSLLQCDYAPARREIIVIADNCTDQTAPFARAAGATVWERQDQERRGKGQAVSWALARLPAERPGTEAVVMMDADCSADRGMLTSLARALGTGADAVQGTYIASNPDASTTAALRFAGYALINLVRPAGKDALGLSCGLVGSGMGFSMRALSAVPWAAFSVTEDKEQHLHLLEAGIRVHFVVDAVVRSPMPTDQRHSKTQQVRWETGNVELARRWVPRLLRRGIRDADVQALHAAWELLVPPLSLIAAPAGAAAAAGPLVGARRVTYTSALTIIGLTIYVAAGLRFAEAPRTVVRALPAVPRLIGRRVTQYAGLARGRGHSEWQRTTRA